MIRTLSVKFAQPYDKILYTDKTTVLMYTPRISGKSYALGQTVYAYAKLIVNIVIIFPLIFRLFVVNSEWAISCSASDELCFRNCPRSGFTVFSVTSFIQTHNIKQIQYIPTFVYCNPTKLTKKFKITY